MNIEIPLALFPKPLYGFTGEVVHLAASIEEEPLVVHTFMEFLVVDRRIASGKFLSYMVNQRGIEANPKKIKALIKMKSPRRSKDVQYLIRRMAAHNRFVSKATDKCLPFFKILKGSNMFKWTTKCEASIPGPEETPQPCSTAIKA
ncbi:Retrovirus-related Pol polyprotein from transposon opus [Abeliophyllum distichum]|uniref:Retrovirus-related Pol polyprotein from transposon opus n=1 Tax=Abeliophyllum distichum TaxID=126358 RepID=A0ABD1V6E1_9LAMI